MRFLLALVGCFGWAQTHAQCNRYCDYFKIEPKTITTCQDTQYVLKFQDEFNGKWIDKDVWMLIPWKQGSAVGEGEVQVNTLDPDNLEMSDGTLKIHLIKKEKERKLINWEPEDKVMEDSVVNLRTYEYSSSNIWTKQSDFGKGKYEIRFRIGGMDAMWPAFWMYSGDGPTEGGSRWNELDIFEIFYKKNKWDFTTNVHYDYENDGSNADNFCSSHLKRKDLDQWHVVTCYFTENQIHIYIDDELVESKYKYRTSMGRPVTCNHPKRKARKEMYGWPRETGHLVLNMAMRNMKELPEGLDDFPCTFEIDYVRYWELSEPAQ